jgi:hypothetical protein
MVMGCLKYILGFSVTFVILQIFGKYACYHFNTLLVIKVEKKIFVFIYCTEQLNLKNISSTITTCLFFVSTLIYHSSGDFTYTHSYSPRSVSGMLFSLNCLSNRRKLSGEILLPQF